MAKREWFRWRSASGTSIRSTRATSQPARTRRSTGGADEGAELAPAVGVDGDSRRQADREPNLEHAPPRALPDPRLGHVYAERVRAGRGLRLRGQAGAQNVRDSRLG